MENKFIELRFNKENSIVYATWQPATATALWTEMQRGMLLYSDFMHLHKPKRVLIDESRLQYTWAPDEQIWVDENVSKKTLLLGRIKHAIVQSNDVFNMVAVEQMMDEENSKKIDFRFFNNFGEAEKWLMTSFIEE
jgi:hypothetical protein